MAGIGKVMDEVKKAVVGKDAVLLRAVLAILAGGHILLEDVPGVGKTTMALAFSKALGLRYNRMQFTPDVLPSDVTGFSLYNKAVGKMEYQPGAVLCNLFLADELNRATSRTQAALLEAMEEGQVTVDGVTHALPRPFIVIATQNPAGAPETEGQPPGWRAAGSGQGRAGGAARTDRPGLCERRSTGLYCTARGGNKDLAGTGTGGEPARHTGCGRYGKGRGACPGRGLCHTCGCAAHLSLYGGAPVDPRAADKGCGRAAGRSDAQYKRAAAQMRVWAARAVYGLALGGAVLFYCFYFGQLAWYVLMLAVCLPLFSLVVSLPAMLTAGIVLHAPAAVEREKTCVLQVYMLGWMPAARMEVRISVEDRTHPGQDCARWLHLRGEAPAEWELDTAHCAALRCSVRRAWVYDYLGLFRLPVRRPGAVIVTVRPRPVALSPEPPLPGAVSGGPMKPRVGAYAEEHELRPYRPGDPMRTVHWKLTAKTGEMIVREALVPCRARALLLVERRGGPDALDRVLEHLCWLSARLTQQGVSHTVLWPGENGVVHTALVDEAGQLDALLYRLLAEPADGADGWAPGWAPPQAEWSYTLRAEKEAADDAG